MGEYDATVWQALGVTLTAVGLLLSGLVWRRRGAASGLRGVAWSLLPLAAALIGLLRVVWEVATVEGTHRGDPVVAPLFRFRPREGQLGAFEASGTVPQIASALVDRGEDVGDWLFAPGVDA